MEAPKCKLCGERHYGLCARNSNPLWPIKTNTTKIDTPEVRAALEEAFAGAKKRFDRTAYQREYMRKRRAKEKK